MTIQIGLGTLPTEIQHRVFSFLTQSELHKFHLVSNTMRESVKKYLQHFLVAVETLFWARSLVKPGPLGQSVIAKTNSCTDFVVEHPNFKDLLSQDAALRTRFFSHFILDTNVDSAMYDRWSEKKPHYFAPLVEQLFATEEPDACGHFLRLVCRKSKRSADVVFSNGLAAQFFLHLDMEWFGRLYPFSMTPLEFESFFIPAFTYLNNPYLSEFSIETDLDKFFQIFTFLYHRNPTSTTWNNLQASLRCYLVVLKISEAFKEPSDEGFRWIAELPDIHDYISRFMVLIRTQIETVREEKFVDLMRAFLRHKKAIDFLRSILSWNNFQRSPLFTKTYLIEVYGQITDSLEKFRIIQLILFKIESTEAMQTFMETSCQLPEPRRSIHLRALRQQKYQEKQLPQIFQNHGLNIDDFPPITQDVLKKFFEFSTRDFFLSQEKLKEVLGSNILKRTTLRAMAGGIQFSKQVILRPILSEKELSSVFKKNGLIFKHFNQPVIFDDLWEFPVVHTKDKI